MKKKKKRGRRGGGRGEPKSEAVFYCSQNLLPWFETCSLCQPAAGQHTSRSSPFLWCHWGFVAVGRAPGLKEDGEVGGGFYSGIFS